MQIVNKYLACIGLLCFAGNAVATQVVHLNFEGGEYYDPISERTWNISAFDPDLEGIDNITAGDRAEIIQEVQIWLVELFDGLDIVFSVNEPAETCSTIFFGSEFYDGQPLLYGGTGDSQGIDAGNLKPDDDGLVYTSSFGGVNGGGPYANAQEYALAFAIVAAHELGHLLGLVHTAGGASDIMQPGREKLRNADAAFVLAPLEDNEEESQNAPFVLWLVLGTNPTETTSIGWSGWYRYGHVTRISHSTFIWLVLAQL